MYTNEKLLREAHFFREANLNITLEQYMDILCACNSYDLNLSDAEIIKFQPVVNDIWLHLESDQSLQHYIDRIVKWMKDFEISVEEVRDMERHELLQKVFDYGVY